jgi:hypothetical protein
VYGDEKAITMHKDGWSTVAEKKGGCSVDCSLKQLNNNDASEHWWWRPQSGVKELYVLYN